MSIREKTPHQQRVEEFMIKAKQTLPDRPTLPDEGIRLLRAKLILEEALETVFALGFSIEVNGLEITSKRGFKEYLHWDAHDSPDLEGIADGCADIKVVTTGTLSACGIADDSVQREVDCNNLSKFEHRCPKCEKVLKENSMPVNEPSGSAVLGERKCLCCGTVWRSGYHNDDGKWVKPEGFVGPRITAVLDEQIRVVEEG